MEITKAEAWINENKNIFKGRVELPLYISLSKEKKERTELLAMRNSLGDISKVEFDEMANALFFKFWEKEDFIYFNMAMNATGILVYSILLV